MGTAVVTGANSGIGLALTLQLVRQGWAVAALVRRTSEAHPDLVAAGKQGSLRLYQGDLADADSRREAVHEIAAAEPTIDVLFNNAGVSTGALSFSPQGRELHYEVNCIAPYVLIQGLTDNLARATAAKVVNVASDAIFYAKAYDPATLSQPKEFRKVTGPYASSKLALCLSTMASAPSLTERGIGAVSMTPGPNATPLLRGPGMPRIIGALARLIAKPPTHGAALMIQAAGSTHTDGQFLMKGQLRALPFREKAAETLRRVTEDA